MIRGLDDNEIQALTERMFATTIANQAVIKCQIAGLRPTIDNIILFVGDFADPGDPRFAALIHELERAIADVSEIPRLT